MTWPVFYPLVMLAIYTFIFGIVLRPTWLPVSSSLDLAVFIFTGLVTFNFFAECVVRAPSLLSENIGFVKKIRFPLEILSLVVVLSSLAHALIAYTILLAFCWVGGHALTLSIVLFPLVLISMVPLLLGLNWVLSTAGVFVRDLSHAIGFIVQALGFLSPLFYGVANVPTNLRSVILAGPVAIPIETTRVLVLGSGSFSWLSTAIYVGVGIVAAIMGFKWFQFARREFADVI
jgi:lipopolysaccharide transport system permease protein